MTADTRDLEIELAPGLTARAAELGEGTISHESIYCWPTELDEKAVVSSLIEILAADATMAMWRQEVIADLSVITVRMFMANQTPFLENNSGLVRFNTGPRGGGFSVTARIDDGVTELQGIFDKNSDELASKVIESTIVDAGKGRAGEIIGLLQTS